MSVATALHYAASRRTLIVSTDPAGSLAGIFRRDFGDEVVAVEKNLDVVELTRAAVLRLWREKFADEIYTVISALVPVERDIIDYIEGAPGIDEEFMLDYVLTLQRSGTYDIIVWDTAPTTTTLNLLQVQQLFYTHLTQAQKLYMKFRGLFNRADPVRLIGKWRQLTADIMDMLRTVTSAWVVTNPERLPVEQALLVGGSLERFGIRLNGYIMNKVLAEEVCAGSDFLHAKRKEQQRWLENLARRTTTPIRRIPELVGDISAQTRLREVADRLFNDQEDESGTTAKRR
jgi:arsenite-transporting ATPase